MNSPDDRVLSGAAPTQTSPWWDVMGSSNFWIYIWSSLLACEMFGSRRCWLGSSLLARSIPNDWLLGWWRFCDSSPVGANAGADTNADVGVDAKAGAHSCAGRSRPRWFWARISLSGWHPFRTRSKLASVGRSDRVWNAGTILHAGLDVRFNNSSVSTNVEYDGGGSGSLHAA